MAYAPFGRSGRVNKVDKGSLPKNGQICHINMKVSGRPQKFFTGLFGNFSQMADFIKRHIFEFSECHVFCRIRIWERNKNIASETLFTEDLHEAQSFLRQHFCRMVFFIYLRRTYIKLRVLVQNAFAKQTHLRTESKHFFLRWIGFVEHLSSLLFCPT